MASTYDAKICDCCGELYHATDKDGMILILEGNRLYPRIAKEKWIFEDCCEDCRANVRRAIESALPPYALGQKPTHLPLMPAAAPGAVVDADFAEVGEKPNDDDQPF
jgi:hypothetical protein